LEAAAREQVGGPVMVRWTVGEAVGDGQMGCSSVGQRAVGGARCITAQEAAGQGLLATMRSGRGANYVGDLRGSRAGVTGLPRKYGM
jgi:hypothetical protein